MQIDAATAAVIAAIAAIVAAIVSGLFALFSQWLERKREGESVSAGIRAEIQAILDIAKRRDYIASLSNFINQIKDGSTNGQSSLLTQHFQEFAKGRITFPA